MGFRLTDLAIAVGWLLLPFGVVEGGGRTPAGGQVGPGMVVGVDGERVPVHVRQLLVATAEGWDSAEGQLALYERAAAGARWEERGGGRIGVLFGRSGLAWGRGVLPPVPVAGRYKVEGDGRTPAGLFALGRVYTHDAALPGGHRYPFVPVGRWDCWVDDPKNPFYNRHVRIDPSRGIPEWYESQRMKIEDPTYRWLVEIRHNSDPPVAGAGSAIFFHKRRAPGRKTAGCTVMAEDDLVRVIRWLDAAKYPHYAVLPQGVYEAVRGWWGLP